jgi:hypothetical protein
MEDKMEFIDWFLFQAAKFLAALIVIKAAVYVTMRS